ncbi:MAG: hypothetical protein ACJAX5_001404 [Patiriisocius sp.]|jgi:hypothetical protein
MNDQNHSLENPATVKRILQVFYGLCGILLVLDFILTRKTEHPLETIPGFYAIYGFVGCIILVVIATWMRRFLMRGEDYYNTDHSDSDTHRGSHVDD